MKNETMINTAPGVRAITEGNGLWFVWRDISEKITGSVNPDLILDLFSDEDKSTATIDGRELVIVNTHALLGLLHRQFIRRQ